MPEAMIEALEIERNYLIVQLVRQRYLPRERAAAAAAASKHGSHATAASPAEDYDKDQKDG
jgi:hypothetical protein